MAVIPSSNPTAAAVTGSLKGRGGTNVLTDPANDDDDDDPAASSARAARYT